MATFQYGGLIEQVATTATAGATTTLVVTSKQVQVFTGTLAQTIALPATNAYNEPGAKFEIHNLSTGVLTIQDSAAGTIALLQSNMTMVFKVTTPTGSPGTWVGMSGSGTATLPIAGGGTGQITAIAGFNALSPITSTGDLILGNGANSATRLPIGSNNFVLTSNGTTASWQPSVTGAGVGDLSEGFVSLSGNTTLTVSNDGQAIEVDTTAGAFTVTMPAVPISGDKFHFKDIGGQMSVNQLTINGNGKNIEGLSSSYIVYANNWDRVLFYDGTAYWLM